MECEIAAKWSLCDTPMTGKAMESLRAVGSQIDTTRRGEPARLIVLTAFGHGYQTDDDIAVVGLTALNP